MCNNTNGGHNCTCKKGFIEDGENCTGKILPYKPLITPGDFSISFKLTSRELCFFVFYCFQISTNVERKHTIAVIMPCVTTPRENTVVHARKASLGME